MIPSFKAFFFLRVFFSLCLEEFLLLKSCLLGQWGGDSLWEEGLDGTWKSNGVGGK